MKPIEADITPLSDHITISLFGGFRISARDVSIHDSATRTHQLWHLIEYLIAMRHQTVTQDELIEALWPGGDIENPVNALKNLVYRLRTSFSHQGFPFAKDIIVYRKGNYHWNNALPCTVDAELFEHHCHLASNTSSPVAERIWHYGTALSLYSGDYLSTARYESWVIPIAAYYRGLYFRCVYAIVDLLTRENRFADIEGIAQKALDIDQFEENIHITLLNALVQQGKNAQALAHYSFVNDLFFRELGVKPSDAMHKLFQDISKTVHTFEADISAIQEELRESTANEGAFYCEYEVFKNMYRLEARTAARSGKAIFIGLITVSNESKNIPMDLQAQSKAMDGLFAIIRGSLRKGDVYARFSVSQYVLMLPSLTYEDSVMVMQRIIKKHKQIHRTKGIALQYKVQPLNPGHIG